jgi:ComF family protein
MRVRSATSGMFGGFRDASSRAGEPAGLPEALDRGLLDLLLPRDCAVTGEPLDGGPWRHLSEVGANRLTRIHDPRCLRCGHPYEGLLAGETECPHCRDLRPAFGRAVCAFRAVGAARRLIHRMKYSDAPWLAEDLADAALEDEVFRRHLAGSVLVPVPLHGSRAAERGYDQALVVARALARRAPGCSLARLLRRTQDTPTQTRLGRAERRRNVAAAFTATGRPDAAVRHVVVDDVLTTGATLSACARALRRAGARLVDAAALAHG